MVKTVQQYGFGDKIREIRERKGVTLREVARTIAVSESLVSQIERNKVSPSIDTLLRLAEALDIDLDYLFKDYKRTKQVSIIRKDERSRAIREGVTYEQLSVIQNKDDRYGLEALFLEIPAGCERGNREFGHAGKELGIIISGEGEFEYGTQTYCLKEGDSVSFSSDIPHTLRNIGTGTLAAIWVITPPRMIFGK